MLCKHFASILCTYRATGKSVKEIIIMKKVITIVGAAAVVALGAMGIKKLVNGHRA